MPKIPKSQRELPRHHINFYGSNGSIPIQELVGYLGNRGYDVRVIEIEKDVSENLPGGLSPEKKYTVVRAVVTILDPQRTDGLEGLIGVSDVNDWRVTYHNSPRILNVRRR